MMDHLVHGYGDGVLVAQDHHAQRIAHKDDIDAGLVENQGRRKIVGRQGDDLFPRSLFCFEETGRSLAVRLFQTCSFLSPHPALITGLR
jgi:hypothetical protein